MKALRSHLPYINLARPWLTWALVLCAEAATARVNLPPNAPAPMRFAADAIARAVGTKPLAIDVSLAIQSNGVPQSYRIERDGANLSIIGGDAVGAMYDGLDVAEALRLGRLRELKADDGGEATPRKARGSSPKAGKK